MHEKNNLETSSLLTDKEWSEGGGQESHRGEGGDDCPEFALAFG